MIKIPARFKRTAAAFDEAAKVRSWESSGSEHSSDDLSDLVNSFLERETEEVVDHQDKHGNEIDFDDDNELDSTNSPDFESRDLLNNLSHSGNDAVRASIHAEVEKARSEGSSSPPDFKRRLTTLLRNRGFDAGLCKSRWEKIGRCPTGDYEYVDVNSGGARYIVEVFIAEEFTIARPSGAYAALLELLPPVFVGKPEELKQVVRLMCNATRKSMRSAGIHVPPWRRLAYMQNKWFASYKRTINEFPTGRKEASKFGGGLPVDERGAAGFVAVKRVSSFYCRGDFAAEGVVRIGNLAAAFNQKEMML